MKVTDLMIGDFVKCREQDCGGHRVDYISEMDDEVGVDGEILDLNMIFPIPLTPEILEKNGFGFGGGYIYKLDDSQMVIEYSYGFLFGWVFCHKKQLNYVHELQHVLRLCGIKKK